VRSRGRTDQAGRPDLWRWARPSCGRRNSDVVLSALRRVLLHGTDDARARTHQSSPELGSRGASGIGCGVSSSGCITARSTAILCERCFARALARIIADVRPRVTRIAELGAAVISWPLTRCAAPDPCQCVGCDAGDDARRTGRGAHRGLPQAPVRGQLARPTFDPRAPLRRQPRHHLAEISCH